MSILTDVESWVLALWAKGSNFGKGALAMLKSEIPGLEHDAVIWLEAELGKIVAQVEQGFVGADGQLKWDTAMPLFEGALKTAGGDFMALLKNQTLRDTLLQDIVAAAKAGLIVLTA